MIDDGTQIKGDDFLRMNGSFFARWVWNAIIDRQNKTLFIHFAIFLKNIVLQEVAKY